MSDRYELMDAILDMYLALSKLDPEQQQALESEGLWVRAQIARGRTPTPEALLDNAPTLMRLVANLDIADGQE